MRSQLLFENKISILILLKELILLSNEDPSMRKSSSKFGALLPFDSYQQMKWKNGGGRTSQIAIYPPDADFPKSFLWRLSSAEISSDGPFSIFENYDRFLTLVSGEALKLSFKDASYSLALEKGRVLRFSGAEMLSGEVPHGPVRDLNLIFEREKVQARFHIIDLGEEPRLFQLKSRTLFLFSLSGSFSASISPSEESYLICEMDTLQVSSSTSSSEAIGVSLQANTPNCSLAYIEIEY